MRFFGKKTRKLRTLEKLKKYDDERVFFQGKNIFTFKIASLPNWQGAKYAGGSRPSCWNLPSSKFTLGVDLVIWKALVFQVALSGGSFFSGMTEVNRINEGVWKAKELKLPDDKIYLDPTKAFAHPGCWTREELEERYWTRRFQQDQFLTKREPVEVSCVQFRNKCASSFWSYYNPVVSFWLNQLWM